MTPADLTILFDTYSPRLIYFAFSMIKDREAAKDIVSKVFVKIWQSGLTFRECERNRLYARVKNGCLDFIKVRKRRQQHEVIAEPPETEDIIDRYAIESEVINYVYEEIKRFPKRQQEVFIRTYFKQQQDTQIAEEMGCTMSTVRNQRSLGVERLRRKIGHAK